ncbi:DUF3833 domain-containing protein [Pseudomonas lurida]|uniref:DUF3833 domain-containing protein n=1 Tax=Pseudomonas lurida TaxID=244566 RepID=UPI001656DE0C|nr:DUF3833 domain-containing protein [Pseudomonas lurida]MBC8982381.1 DUF3833 domain-containing protein [Pseudomonas lurida]
MRKPLIAASLAALLAGSLTGCAGPDVQHYKNVEPRLDVARYFAGTTDAWGMFQRRNGEVVKRFHVTITGTGDDQAFTLDERFSYDDGTNEQRVWKLTRTADGGWIGRAGDVRGDANGEVSGNALRWQYTLMLPVDGTTWAMSMDDWMFLIDDCTMINRASMSKFGVEVGQVTLTFRRRACAP